MENTNQGAPIFIQPNGQAVRVSTSFAQDQKHVSRSEKYVQIQTADIGQKLLSLDAGFVLGHVKTGRARKPENAHHQVNISRFQKPDDEIQRLCGNGSTLDILVRNVHLGGCLEFRLGFFRGFCANAWNTGTGVTSIKVRHTGDALEKIEELLPRIVAQRDEMIDLIKSMQARNVSPLEIAQLTKTVIDARLADTENLDSVDYAFAMRPMRKEDAAPTLFNVINVLEEKARLGIPYTTKTVNDQNETVIRQRTTRRLDSASNKAFDLAGTAWETAVQFLKQAA